MDIRTFFDKKPSIAESGLIERICSGKSDASKPSDSLPFEQVKLLPDIVSVFDAKSTPLVTPTPTETLKESSRNSWYPGKSRNTPAHLGEKDIPIGSPNCLQGERFVVTGVLDFIEREDCEDLIKQYGGRVSKSLSKSTKYLICGSEPGPSKVAKAKQWSTKILSEDDFFQMIKASNPTQKPLSAGILSEPVNRRKNMQSSCVPKTTKSVPSEILWSDKYRPSKVSDVIGNVSAVKSLVEYLNSFHTSKKNPKALGVLLSGPPGIGKTSAAIVAAKSCGFDIVEFNASDKRSKKCLQEFVSDMGSTHSILQFTKPKSKASSRSNSVLIMDEVDGMSSGDRGGIQELISFLKTSKVPVICICNDRSSPKVKTLANYCVDLRFRRPTAQLIANRLVQISTSEGLELDKLSLEKLAHNCRADIRQVFNTLQMWSASSKSMSFTDVKSCLEDSQKDFQRSMFDVAPDFFRSTNSCRRSWMKERTQLYFVEPSMLPLFVQESYLLTNGDNSFEALSKISEAAEFISRSDILDTMMRSNQSFHLMPMHAALSCVIPGFIMSGVGGRGITNFPSWLGKNSSKGKNYRLLNEVKSHMGANVSGDSSALLLDYIPLLATKICDLLVNRKKDGIDDVLHLMDAYNLDMDDFCTVLQFMQFNGPSPKIETQVKSALTRTFNKRSNVVSRRSSKSVHNNPSELTIMDEEDDDNLAGLTSESDPEDQDIVIHDKLIVRKKASSRKRPGSKRTTKKAAKKSKK